MAWPGSRQLGAQEPLSLPHRNAALQQEGADLIDNAGALADQALPYPVQRLQVELIRGLRRHELHGRSLHRLAIASASRKSFFCPFEYEHTSPASAGHCVQGDYLACG